MCGFFCCFFFLDKFLGGKRDPPRSNAEDPSRSAESVHPHCQGIHLHTKHNVNTVIHTNIRKFHLPFYII